MSDVLWKISLDGSLDGVPGRWDPWSWMVSLSIGFGGAGGGRQCWIGAHSETCEYDSEVATHSGDSQGAWFASEEVSSPAAHIPVVPAADVPSVLVSAGGRGHPQTPGPLFMSNDSGNRIRGWKMSPKLERDGPLATSARIGRPRPVPIPPPPDDV